MSGKSNDSKNDAADVLCHSLLEARKLFHLADTTFDGAKCDDTCRFGAHANLEAGVKIKPYGVFGYMFRVQRQTVIGISVVAGREVEIGHHSCIEGFVVIPAFYRIKAFTCVKRADTPLGFVVMSVKYGWRCYLSANQQDCEYRER